MKPEFMPFRVHRSETEIVTGRIPEPLKKELETIATNEGNGVSGLVLEGIIRVLQDRIQDTNDNNNQISAALRSVLDKKSDAIELELESTRAASKLINSTLHQD